MLRNYFKIALRNLLKDRQFTFLNLLGLSAGLACALLIYCWVYDELSFDRFHEHGKQLFQVMENRLHAEGVQTSPETPALLAETLKETMPEVEHAAVSTPPSWFRNVALSVGNENIKATGLFTGKDYFNIFSYPLIQGNKEQVLAGKNAIVISEELALKLFHTTENIVGKRISWQLDDLKKHGIVTGVFKGTPANSSVQFDFALPFEVFKDIMDIRGSMGPQGPFFTYLVLKEGADMSGFNAKLSALMKSRSKGQPRNLFLKPFAENYLYGNYENGVQSGGRIVYVKLFSAIALFIIAIACINFMNLTTARASGRMKEIGIQKAMGSGRKTLVFQYLGESTLMAFLALIVALLLVMILLPSYNEITGKRLTLHMDASLILSFLGITFLTGLIAGSYPAIYLSGFKPLTALKGKLHTVAGGLWVRKGLIVFQFALSVIFIVAVLVVYRQMAYLQNKSLGYNKDQVIYFESEGKVPGSVEAFLSEIKNIPGVAGASGMVGNVLSGPSIGIPWKKNGQEETIMFRPFLVNYDLIETLDIKMAAGRAFSRDFGSDSSRIIFNEAAIKAMGIEDPVGKVIDFGGGNREIVGVAKNFHFQSLHEEVKPLFFQLQSYGSTMTIMVKITAGMEQEVMGRLSAFYKTFNPGFTFDYKFLDEDYQAQYIAEKRVAALSKYFAGLAILISCLGLFGLAAFTAERRKKEIGIRKTLGASIASVVSLLSGNFIRLVLMAVLIALPVGWYAMDRWLEDFAYRIDLQWWMFALAGLLAVVIAMLTVSFQSMKAALINPVKSLRSD